MKYIQTTGNIWKYKEQYGKQKRMPEHDRARKTEQYVKENTEQHGNDYNLHNTEWYTMLAQRENTAHNGKQLEHQNKTRH